jgi:F0F1-type ATP synthase assembly protein I
LNGLFHGLNFGITIALGLGAGIWADRRWCTSPWGVVLGFLGGAAIGFYHLVRSEK